MLIQWYYSEPQRKVNHNYACVCSISLLYLHSNFLPFNLGVTFNDMLPACYYYYAISLYSVSSINLMLTITVCFLHQHSFVWFSYNIYCIMLRTNIANSFHFTACNIKQWFLLVKATWLIFDIEQLVYLQMAHW